MALGAGSVTPMQMATAIPCSPTAATASTRGWSRKITDHKGKVLVDSQPPLLNESMRAIDARNAFMMDRLLQEVARSGTAARAQRDLKRPDLYGKTGTTNDSIDTWFNGFQPTLAAIVWMGYDTPRSLGDRETGGGLSLPIWINFMEYGPQGRAGDGYPPRPKVSSTWAASGITASTPGAAASAPWAWVFAS
jgi:penicillin-binding protein 1A